MGLGHSWADVAGLTLIQRAVPDEVLARVFGVIQMLFLAAMGIGAALAPALIALLGTDTAIVVTGLLLPALVAVSGVSVARIDAAAPAPDVDELRVLASVPIFAPLPGGSLEHLAARLVPLRVDPGTVIVREGDAGDRFYIVAEGEIEVSQDGQTISELDAGGVFRRNSALARHPANGDRDGKDERRPLRARPGGLPLGRDRARAERGGCGDRHERAPGRPGRDGVSLGDVQLAGI